MIMNKMIKIYVADSKYKNIEKKIKGKEINLL